MSLGINLGHSSRTGDGPFQCKNDGCGATYVEAFPCPASPTCQCVRSSKSSFTYLRMFSDYPFFVCSGCCLPTRPFLSAFVSKCKRESDV